jgi:hypothetical protein
VKILTKVVDGFILILLAVTAPIWLPVATIALYVRVFWIRR